MSGVLKSDPAQTRDVVSSQQLAFMAGNYSENSWLL